jgi:hypothetical protein
MHYFEIPSPAGYRKKLSLRTSPANKQFSKNEILRISV